MSACRVPGCRKSAQHAGLCNTHQRTLPNRTRTYALPGTLPIRPSRTRAQREALHQLAESNPTPAEYAREKARILKGHTP